LPTISFVILAWNSSRYLDACFNSIIAKCDSESLAFEIIVVDNGSTDNSREILERFSRSYPDKFRLIHLDLNKGTTLPRNLALKQAQGKYICIFDSDAEILNGDMSEVLDTLKERHDVGIIAPMLLLDDGTVQNSVKKFPTFCHKLLKIPKIILGIKVANADFYADFPFLQERPVDTAISACWFFRRDLVDIVGYLDEKIYYSPEDLDYCIRARKCGKTITYFPKFVVRHHTQQITHRKPFSKTSLSHFGGLIYYFKKHGGWFFSSVS